VHFSRFGTFYEEKSGNPGSASADFISAAKPSMNSVVPSSNGFSEQRAFG
jgi:hypothetical protein